MASYLKEERGIMKVKFTVDGEPQGKGRPRANVVCYKNGEPVKNPKTGRPIINERTPDNTVIYENLIKTEYKRQLGSIRFPDDALLDMRILAYYTIPASTSKKRQLLMESGEIRPKKKPDMDNIVKAVADSLNNIAYRDDSQIVDCQIRKFYSRLPRIEVTILTAK